MQNHSHPWKLQPSPTAMAQNTQLLWKAPTIPTARNKAAASSENLSQPQQHGTKPHPPWKAPAQSQSSSPPCVRPPQLNFAVLLLLLLRGVPALALCKATAGHVRSSSWGRKPPVAGSCLTKDQAERAWSAVGTRRWQKSDRIEGTRIQGQ